MAHHAQVLVSDRGDGDGRPWAFSSRPGTHDQAPFGLPPRGPYHEMRAAAEKASHQRTEKEATGSNSYSGSDGGAGHGGRFLESLAVFQVDDKLWGDMWTEILRAAIICVVCA